MPSRSAPAITAAALGQDQVGTVAAHSSGSAQPGPGAEPSASAAPALGLAAPVGFWSVSYQAQSAADTNAPAAESAPSQGGPVEAAPIRLPAAVGLDDAPLQLPPTTGLDDHVEALALAMWNDGRKAEAVEFLERQITLARETAKSPQDAVPAPEPHQHRIIPAELPVPAVVAAHGAAPVSRRWPSSRMLAIGVAAVLLAIGADLLTGSEPEDKQAAMLSAQEPNEPDAPSAAAPSAERPREPASSRAAAVPSLSAEAAGDPEEAASALDLGPEVTGSIGPSAAPQAAGAAQAAPADQPESTVAVQEGGLDTLFSGDALHATPLQAAAANDPEGIPNAAEAAGTAAPAPSDEGSTADIAGLPAREDNAPPPEVIDAGASDLDVTEGGAPPPELVEGSPPPEVVEEAVPPPELVEGDPAAEVIYEDQAATVEATPSGPEQPVTAVAPTPEPRLPKARPEIAVAMTPAEPDASAAAAPVEPERSAAAPPAELDRPVLLGRPSGPVSQSLAERRAIAERIAARRRAVAEWHAARRARMVLLGRPYWQ